MPQSMTGFASASAIEPPFHLSWEVRSVNHRFLDLTCRLPEELRRLEAQCRDLVAAKIKRGKLDCVCKLALASEASAQMDVDITALVTLGALEQKVRETLPDAAPLSVAEVLRWSGVIREPARGYDKLEGPALQCLETALGALQTARADEGARIAEFIDQRNRAVAEAVNTIRPMLPEAERRYREKLLERIAKLEMAPDPQRIEQEISIIAQRLDVSEEVDRLASHVAEVAAVLGRDEPMGRRLDFLLQEMNREVNTLSSKSQDETLTRACVDLKVLIEQMREQVQNLE